MNPVILYDNLLSRGALTVTSEATGYPIENVTDLRSFTKWKASSEATQDIEVDLTPVGALLEGAGAGRIMLEGAGAGQIMLEGEASGAELPNAIGIFNHNFGSIGATVKVYRDNGGWELLETINPTTDKPILSYWVAASSIKFKIEISGAAEAPYAGVIMLGVYLSMPDPPDAPYAPVNEGIKVSTEISEAGHLLGSVVEHFPININPRWTNAPNFTRTWYTTYFLPFWEDHGRWIKPFFYGWDLVNRPDDVFYVHLDPGFVRAEALSLLTYTDSVELLLKGVSL